MKSPVFAAILGFFLPPAGLAYTGRWVAAIFAGLFEIVCIALSIIGIGLFMLFIYGLTMGYTCYQAAEKANRDALRKMMASRQAASQMRQ
ncbi:MAG: hypothetical protein JNK87_20920 [Bryobacterales bacterium]|nr:hypothetical protein [Bryobacterales bacterium]